MAIFTFDAYPTLKLRKPVNARTGLHRLFAAAVVSDQFRKTLLSKPEEALTNGYLGQTFALTELEKTIIKSIRADTLSDLAQQVNRALKSL